MARRANPAIHNTLRGEAAMATPPPQADPRMEGIAGLPTAGNEERGSPAAGSRSVRSRVSVSPQPSVDRRAGRQSGRHCWGQPGAGRSSRHRRHCGPSRRAQSPRYGSRRAGWSAHSQQHWCRSTVRDWTRRPTGNCHQSQRSGSKQSRYL